MNVIVMNDEVLNQDVRAVDSRIINTLIKKCLEVKKDDESTTVYGQFYKSKYPIPHESTEEKRLETYINELASDRYNRLSTNLQGNEYRWVKIEKEKFGEVAYRYYFAPDPKKMHEIVAMLTTEMLARKVPVEFKYQLKNKMNECDRIILYSDSEHQHEVEEAIQSVYQKRPNLFEGSERPLPWIYPSKIPNVYIAPETPGSSYGEAFAKAMIEAKETFCFLYGLTNKNNIYNVNKDKVGEVLRNMELIVNSILLRKGLLMSTDGKRVVLQDIITSSYDYQNGTITNVSQSTEYYHRVEFSQTPEGKSALFNNFYNVSRMKPQAGVTVKHLTAKERRKELHDYFGWYQEEFGSTEAKKPRQ